MAARKPDAEVGPLGVWAYDTRDALGLSAAQVASRAGVTEPTIRKVEGGSNKTPSKRLVRDMYDYFREVGKRDDKLVDPPPGYFGELPTPPPDALAAAVSGLVVELAAWRTERVELWARLRAAEAELESLRGRSGDGGSAERPAHQRTRG